MQGTPCIDPNNHPVPGDATNTIWKLLKQDGAGCGTVTGTDTNLAKEILPQDTFAKFILANSDTMTEPNIGTDLFNFYQTSNTPMRLYARDRITVKCSTAACSVNKEFGMTAAADVMFATYNSIWGTLWVLCLVALICTVLALLVLVYVIFLKSRAT
jgi:hypothetical protein